MAQLDSQKLEKLLISATNERQRKMYQSLLQKARRIEQASKKSSSATSNTAKAQTILGKVQSREKTSLLSSSTTENQAKTATLLQPPPKLEKPPSRQETATNPSSVSTPEFLTENKEITKTNQNTSTSTTKNNEKLTQDKSSKLQSESQQQKSKTDKNKSAKKKKPKQQLKEEAPMFQALGKMVLTPYLKDDDLKIELNGLEYDLLYASDFTFTAHRKLRQELKNNGSRKMLLKLYPNTRFSNKSEPVKLSFIKGSFDKKYQTNRKYPEKFKLRGIWQYIPQSPTPVISIYRNIDQLGELKKLNEKQQSKFVRPHHIPVRWDDAPVAPFKYAPEVEKEAQMPRYFVEVRAIIFEGVYVVQEMLKEPTLDIPTHIKAEKLKEYDLENIEAYVKKSKTSKAKDSSLSNQGKFQCVLRGKVLIENESEFFQLENGTKFSVKEIVTDSYQREITEWQVVPVINNDAQIVTLILEKPLSSTELITTPSNVIIEAGRIIEVGKIDDRFKVKVHRQKGKNLKITAWAGEVKMKVGQLWSMKLSLKEGSLHIQEAKYLKD